MFDGLVLEDFAEDEAEPEIMRGGLTLTRRLQVGDELRKLGLYDDAIRFEGCCAPGQGYAQVCMNCANSGRPFAYHFTPFRCMSRVCPECGAYMASQIQERFMPVIEKLMEQPAPDTWLAPWERPEDAMGGLLHVILTAAVPLCALNEERIVGLSEAVAEFVRRMGWNRAGSGALVALEIGEAGKKLHFHLLVRGPFRWKSVQSERTYQAQNGLPLRSSGGPYVSETWEELTGYPIVKIKRVKSERQARYTLKYVVKGADKLLPREMAKLHALLKGKRRVRTYGVFYGKAWRAFEEKVLGDDAHQEREPECCPRCGDKLVYVEMWEYEALARRRYPLAGGLEAIDLQSTIKSERSPPGGIDPNDPYLDENGQWRDELFPF